MSLEMRALRDDGCGHGVIASNFNAHQQTKREDLNHLQCRCWNTAREGNGEDCPNDAHCKLLDVNEL